MKKLKLETTENMSLREAVYRTLRRAILTNQLEPGERLMEMRLAAELGVSRTPVREALHLLEKEALVKQEPNRGVFVAQITRRQLRDVLELRGMLEELAVRLACERAREADFEQLKKAADCFSQAVEQKADVTELAAKDVAFHDVIYHMTENEKLVQMVANLWEQIYRYRIEYLKDRKRGEALAREHQELVRALCARDETAAMQTARLHITNQELAIEKRLEGEGKHVI